MAKFLCYMILYAVVVIQVVDGSCRCRTRRNYLIVIDNTIDREDLPKLSKFVGGLGINLRSITWENRVAVASFTRVISTFAESNSEETFVETMQALNPHPSKNSTLKQGIETVESILVEEESPVPIVIVFIVGSTTSSEIDFNNIAEIYRHRDSIRGFSIGIGEDIRHKQLLTLAGSMDKENILTLETFNDLTKVDVEIALKICGVHITVTPPEKTRTEAATTPRSKHSTTTKHLKTTSKPLKTSANPESTESISDSQSDCPGIKWESGVSKGLIGGTRHGEPIYICRVFVKNRWRLGRLENQSIGCQLVDREQEETHTKFKKYELLVASHKAKYRWLSHEPRNFPHEYLPEMIEGGKMSRNINQPFYIAKCKMGNTEMVAGAAYDMVKSNFEGKMVQVLMIGDIGPKISHEDYIYCEGTKNNGTFFYLLCGEKGHSNSNTKKTTRTTKATTEYPVNDLHRLVSNCNGVEWETGVTEGLVGGSRDGKPIYICRQIVGDQWRLGRLENISRGCQFVDTQPDEFGTKFDNYEVLVAYHHARYIWQQWNEPETMPIRHNVYFAGAMRYNFQKYLGKDMLYKIAKCKMGSLEMVGGAVTNMEYRNSEGKIVQGLIMSDIGPTKTPGEPVYCEGTKNNGTFFLLFCVRGVPGDGSIRK